MQNEPNFQKSGQLVTLDMIRTYNENQPKKCKKNESKQAKFHPKNNPPKPKYSAIGD